MANMSYCRFENTARDLQDCIDNIDANLSNSEHGARKRLIKKCGELLESLGVNFEYGALADAVLATELFQ